ncbi:MAG: ATP-binding protein [Myxococcota bacterium]
MDSEEAEDAAESAPDSWEKRDSGPVPLPPSRRRERISEVDTGDHPTLDVPPDQSLLVPTWDALADVLFELGTSEHAQADDEDILEEYLAAFARVLSGRRFVVRLVSRERPMLDLVRSTGRLAAGRQERLRVTREALAAVSLGIDDARRAGIPVVQQYELDFDGSTSGFDVALTSDGSLIGVLGVEYKDEVPEDDQARVKLAALKLAGALGRARLRHEASYLSGYLARLLDRASVPIIVIDRHRRVQVVSSALLSLLGLSRETVVGRDFLHLVSEAERGALLPVVVAALRGRARDTFEVGLKKADGGVARVSTNLVTILSPKGEIDGIIAIGRDLTELHRLESQILQAEKLATLGQLAAGVVHELNNPLTSISVYAEYLHSKGERENADAADVEKLRRIVQAAERILRFTRDLVTYARPSTEQPRELTVAEVLDQSLVFCEHVVGEAGTSVEKNYEEPLPSVLGVRSQLHQIFINLITNACHAMPMGAGKLMLEAISDEHGVTICVRDNGAGIPHDQLESVFEPFFSTKGEGKGTGLGLSIVRKIVQQHDGRIEIESILGEGTTFRVWLPTS